MEGRVARMTDFGAFVELEPGVDALLHVSRFPESMWRNLLMYCLLVRLVTAKVVDFNGGRQKNLTQHEVSGQYSCPGGEN